MCGIVGAIAHRPVATIQREVPRREPRAAGHQFSLETDTEVIVHAIYTELIAGHPLTEAVRRATARMTGAYALAVIDFQDPDRLIDSLAGLPCTLDVASEYPIAMEGALKLKEITYIHAEAYPAGEFKHGPIALIAPLIFSIPMQLLAYQVAVLKGTDVDQPRNLAKSVTVE